VPEDKQAILDTVNAAIDAILNGGAVQSYSINGRRVDKIPFADLIAMRDRLQREIGSVSSRRTYGKFANPK